MSFRGAVGWRLLLRFLERENIYKTLRLNASEKKEILEADLIICLTKYSSQHLSRDTVLCTESE